MSISVEEKRFLDLIQNVSLREALLERLQAIGELDAFLEIENETIEQT